MECLAAVITAPRCFPEYSPPEQREGALTRPKSIDTVNEKTANARRRSTLTTSSLSTVSTSFEPLDVYQVIEILDGGWAKADAPKSIDFLSSAGVVVVVVDLLHLTLKTV